MKTIITVVAVILIATGALAFDVEKPHNTAIGIGIGIAGASATGGSVKSDIKNTNTIFNANTNLNANTAIAPTTVSPSQTVTVNGVPASARARCGGRR